MTQEPKTVPYRTKDLNQAAFLWSQQGVRLEEVQGSSGTGTTIWFKFQVPLSESGLRQLMIDFANGDTKVEPMAFCAKQNNLRDLLHGTLAHNRKGRRSGNE